jgi:parallel beta helix pectate lyase-like protein
MGTRTWVSGVGDDANPGSRTAPCKTFAGAHSKTSAPGEISVLDPGGYGAVTLTKSITLNGDGTLGSILSASTSGVIINTASTADVVALRSISIQGLSTGSSVTHGVRYLVAGNVFIENCTIANVVGHGIEINVSGVNGKIYIKNTVIRNCGQNGINVIAASGFTVQVFLENVFIEKCITGFHGGSGCKATIRDSAIGVCTTGLHVEQTGGAGSDLPRAIVERTRISECTSVGVQSGPGVAPGPKVILSQCMITNNFTGVTNSGSGTIDSAQNNLFFNGTNGAPTGTATIL